MKIHRHLAPAIVLLAALIQAAHAQVLNQVPGDSLVVVKISNLQATSTKVAAFAKRLGLVELDPSFADPLKALQAKSQMQKGIKTDGEMAFVFLDNKAIGIAPNNSVVLLVPVSDYQAFLGNFPAAKTDAGITQFTFPNESALSYIASWGDYAAISPAKEVLGVKHEGLTVAGLAAKEMSTKDAAVYVNMALVRAKALPELAKGKAMFVAQITRTIEQNPAANPKYVPVARAAIGMLFDAIEAYLRDAQSATFSINLGDEGISTTFMTEFDPQSRFGQTVAQVKNTDATLLTGLPDAKYLMFGGQWLDSPVIGKEFDEAVAPILNELKNLGDEAKPVVSTIDAFRSSLRATKSGSFGMLAPTGMIANSPLLQSIGVVNGDANALTAIYRTVGPNLQEVMNLLQGAGPQIIYSYTPQAKTVDGVTFDELKQQVQANPKSPQAQQAAQLLQFMYGREGLISYYGAVDANHILNTSGVSDAILSSAIASVKAGDDSLSKLGGVKTVAAQLPKQRVGVFYVPIDQIVMTGVNYAKMFGFPIPVQLPPDLPPIGSTLATEGSAVRADTYIPASLVESLVSAGMQIWGGMMKAPPGGPGGPPPGGGL